MHNAIENYINGNLQDAKRLARRFSVQAVAVADYLKGEGTFQAACDAMADAARPGMRPD